MWDEGGGRDSYRAARYAQGAGVHQALGVLRDESGDDEYRLSAGVGQGLGHDMAIGLLVDIAGEDRYAARYAAQGAALSNGVGLLADLGGGGRWQMGPSRLAWGEGEAARGLPSVGLLLHGVLDMCLMSIIDEEASYGYEMVSKLRARGLNLASEGSIYPLLSRLQKQGMIESYLVQSSEGPARKYYRMSEDGREILGRWRSEWREFSTAVDAVLSGGEQ